MGTCSQAALTLLAGSFDPMNAHTHFGIDNDHFGILRLQISQAVFYLKSCSQAVLGFQVHWMACGVEWLAQLFPSSLPWSFIESLLWSLV